MKRAGLLSLATIVVLVQFGIPATLPAQQPAPADPQAACRLLIERSRMTGEGQMLLQRLMRANEAPALMDRLVHLAKNVGGGDLTAGLSRMLDTVERAERQSATPPPAPPTK